MLKYAARSLAATTVALTLVLVGCSNGPTDGGATPVVTDNADNGGTSTSTTSSPLTGQEIDSIDSASTWASGLTSSSDSADISAGLIRIRDLLPDLGLSSDASGELDGELASLNDEVLASPSDAGSLVPQVKDVVAEIVDELDG